MTTETPALIQLTPQQRAVVEHPHTRPLRVAAGAGSGKTSTLARRVAAAVDAGVEPEAVLGITFTNKAAEELTETIRETLGDSDAGRQVEVTTYHGFAHGIVREFGPFIGIPRDARIVTPGYVRQLVRDASAARPRTHVDLTNPGGTVARLVALSSSLGDHLQRPEALASAGSPELIESRSELAEILETFQSSKTRLGVVDYSDLVVSAHRIVDEHPAIADRLRSRYDLVVLDEYQDTNPAQRSLLVLLFGGGFPVTAVGDSDQTIYEWRGASLENFEAFPEHFPEQDGTPARTLPLSISWRSGPQIVEIANRVRSEITHPGPLTSLEAAPEAPSGSVRTHWARTSIDEALWIADEVRRLHDEEGRAWSDIAILFRKHLQMSVIRDALSAAGVPVEVASLGGLLDVPEVAEIHAWLRILGRSDDAPALARILLGSRYRLGLADLAPLTAWVSAQSRTDDDATIGWAMLEAVDAVDDVAGLRPEARDRIERFRAEYRELLETAQATSLVDLCRSIIDATHIWSEIEALPADARLTARLNVYRFLDLAEDWSPLDRRPSLAAFLEHLDLLREDHVADELDSAVVSGEDAVSMLTVHRAKGLEWPVVILPALARGTFPSQRGPGGVDPDEHPHVVPFELRLDSSDRILNAEDRDQAFRTQHDDAEWRTAYVAVTRARDELIATGAWWYSLGRPKSRSPLFDLIDAEAERLPGRIDEPGAAPSSLRLDTGAMEGPDPHFPSGPIALLRESIAEPGLPRRLAVEAGISPQYDAAVEQLEIQLSGLPAPVEPSDHAADIGFRTSVTGLVTFGSCGLRFKWEQIERLPRRPSPAARRGSELHRRIELHHRGTITFDEAVPEFSPPDLADAPSEAVGTAFERFLDSTYATERPILVETPFDLVIDSATISGRIDAIYETPDGGWEIVDFKSGRPSTDPHRSIQLEAYAVAAADVTLEGHDHPTRTTVSFVYLGGSEMVVESDEVDAGWLDTARRHLAELAHGAEHGPYEAEPGPWCRHCDYATFCEPGRAWLEENA